MPISKLVQRQIKEITVLSVKKYKQMNQNICPYLYNSFCAP